jgi:hypothetical protein
VASGKPEKKHPLWTGTRSGQVLDNAMAGVRQSWAIAVCEHRHLNPPPQRGEPAGDDLGVEFVLEIAPEGSPDAVIETDDKEIQIAGARETAATCCLSRSNTALPGSGKKSRFQVE